MFITSLVVKLFYPPSNLLLISPILALFVIPAEGIVEIVVLAILVIFSYPVRTSVEKESFLSIRTLAIYAGIGYLVLSLMPYAFKVPYPQTYIGLVIAFNVINGAIAGLAVSLVRGK
ncbi:hypothetical protein CM19_08180 [Candidatus Acidianus copahuensis]|uniref:Uncharacterized protein n=2 Tax=Candidatus Acidianus copahuensis TaxID=1160895 RepID=A0A031LLI4_9CREN|nr:hypothetical protein CM19_08180 [Candidatus Acidianus copahuensis]